MERQMTVDLKAIVGEAVELTAHVNCVHCDVMLPEFSRFCLLCGHAQFEAVHPMQPEPEQSQAGPTVAHDTPTLADSSPPIELAPEVLYVEPPIQPPEREPCPFEKIKSMQKVADAKLSRMESDRNWAKKLVQK